MTQPFMYLRCPMCGDEVVLDGYVEQIDWVENTPVGQISLGDKHITLIGSTSAFRKHFTNHS